jgi:hypothetical protein
MDTTEPNPLESIQEAMTEAVNSNHELTVFDRVDNGFQATFKKCNMTTWVGRKGVRYSLLSEQCDGSG